MPSHKSTKTNGTGEKSFPTAKRSIPDILQPLQPAMARLEVLLEEQCRIFEPGVADCVRYATSNQGKRLRPSLVIFSANTENGKPAGTVDDDLLTMCAIVELIHIATLIHDDIMDGAHIRRNRPTAVKKWGQEISVLLGDCLFAHALTLAASYPTPEVCRKVATATNIVCSGEILQTQRRFDLKLQEEEYLKMVEMKTGKLFALSCEMGARLAGASEERCMAHHEFGRLLGIAYQIYDDCLDLFGVEKNIGKSLGTDLQKGKITLPVIRLLAQAEPSESHLISSILLNEHANSHAMLVEFIRRYDTLRQSAQAGRELLQQALNHLQGPSDHEGTDCLKGLALCLDAELGLLA